MTHAEKRQKRNDFSNLIAKLFGIKTTNGYIGDFPNPSYQVFTEIEVGGIWGKERLSLDMSEVPTPREIARGIKFIAKAMNIELSVSTKQVLKAVLVPSRL